MPQQDNEHLPEDIRALIDQGTNPTGYDKGRYQSAIPSLNPDEDIEKTSQIQNGVPDDVQDLIKQATTSGTRGVIGEEMLMNILLVLSHLKT